VSGEDGGAGSSEPDNVAALQRAVDELRFHDERRRNYDSTKPATVTRHHREFEGDEWGRLVAERSEALKDAFCCDAGHACHVSRDEIIAVSFRVGSLHVDFSVRHNEDVSSDELDERIEAYDFPLVKALYADREGPKTGLDAALEEIEALRRELEDALLGLSAAKALKSPVVDSPSPAFESRLSLLKAVLAVEEQKVADCDAAGDGDGASLHATRADELRCAILYVEAACSTEGCDVGALMERVDEHTEGVQLLQREIASRDEAVTSLQEALVLAKTSAGGSNSSGDGVVASRTALLAELRKELATAHGEQAQKLRRAIADVEALAAGEDGVDTASESPDGVAALQVELAREHQLAEALQQELQRVRAAHKAEAESRDVMLELYAEEVKAMQEQLSEAQAAEDAARLNTVLKERQWKQESRQQAEEAEAQRVAEQEALQAELQRRSQDADKLRQEVSAAREELEELRWYDERRDNCAAEKPVKESYLHRIFDGDGWGRVMQDCEEELRWMLHIDCSRACHVNLEHIARIDFVLGSLHVDFCVQHNTDVAKSELRDRLAEYPFPATWGLYRRVQNAQGSVDSLFIPSNGRLVEKLLLEQAAARAELQVSELEMRQEWMRELGNKTAELFRNQVAELMMELEESVKECTDNLEKLEECAALLGEARESERELRDRLFAAAEETFELHRKYDEEKRQREEREEQNRRAISEFAARAAECDGTIRHQANEIVELQGDLHDLTDTLGQKNEEIEHLRERESDLLRKLEDSAAEYVRVVKRLDRCGGDLAEAQRAHDTLITQLAELQARTEELEEASATQTANHRKEMKAAEAEKVKWKEGTDVVRELVPQLIAAASGEPAKDYAAAAMDSADESDEAFLAGGQLNVQELRDALLQHLSQVEQLHRDKASLSDDLDAAEKLRNECLTSLENTLRTLAEEQALRMHVQEEHVQFAQQLMRQMAIMCNSEEEDVVDESHNGDIASNFDPASLRSATPSY
jgi:chromosome segregation ATPase